MKAEELKRLRVAIMTFGCQMNEYDSEVAVGLLEKAGFELIRDDGEKGDSPPKRGQSPFSPCHPEEFRPVGRNDEGSRNGDPSAAYGSLRMTGGSARDGTEIADVILLNTCSVREHAEDRVYSRLGMLGKVKKERPELVVGLMGCMVEEHREKLFKRFPQLDFMVGTRNIKELPALIEEVRQRRRQVSRIKQSGISIEYTDLIRRTSKFHAWLPIMTGCDKVCTFCIVPITRGGEVSMPAREIYREASRLVSEGVKWITLLGQNVNSYGGGRTDNPVIARSIAEGDATKAGAPAPALDRNPLTVPSLCDGTKQSQSFEIASSLTPTSSMSRTRNDDQTVSFPNLLETLCQIDGLERISFTTSHPSDATEELFQVIARNPKISRRFHLPLQSGSDRILKRMKRLHTYVDYKRKVARLRGLVPDISITTDILVGFSGETGDDHSATKRALAEIRYDGAYIYKYSVRPSTPAAKLDDDVPQALKEERHQELLELQKGISAEQNSARLGRRAEVFVEGPSAKRADQLVGRTLQEKRVVFDAPPELMGTFQAVKLLEVKNETFRGELEEVVIRP